MRKNEKNGIFTKNLHYRVKKSFLHRWPKRESHNFHGVKTDRLTSSYTLMYEDKKNAIPEWIAIINNKN